MTLAQRLYEAGKITYMRTDSTNISDDAKNQIKNFVVEKFGKDFFAPRSFSKKTKMLKKLMKLLGLQICKLKTLREMSLNYII